MIYFHAYYHVLNILLKTYAVFVYIFVIFCFYCIDYFIMHISSAEFITSAAKLSQCPESLYPEFAFF